MKFIKVHCFFLFLFVFAHVGKLSAQQLNWALKTGGGAEDVSNAVFTDAAGNVYKAGSFSGSNIDFDPGPGAFLLSSAGSVDAFVAKYTSGGQFLWAFRFGGSNRDNISGLRIDVNGNVLITGYFRGPNVDFDPGPGTAIMSSNGDAGGDPGYGGDIFVAKYTATGQYIWAFQVGGTSIGDSGINITTDQLGDVYVGGYFFENIDFNPGPGTANLDAANGTLFLAKYTSAGNYQWAFNFGLGNSNNSVFDIKVDAAGNLYTTGYFQGTNIDFDPGPGTAPLTSSGNYEVFVAKYTTAGQYQFAFRIGGTSLDVGRGIELDNAGNIYVLGDFGGSNIDFDPGPGTAPLTSNGPADVFLAKYTSTGQYVWAFNFGGAGGEFGWRVSSDQSHLFVTGGFTGTADLDPSAAVDNLVSNGGYDIFLGKYTFNGEYLCSFKIGGSGDDFGQATIAPAPNLFYITGSFQGTNVDFDPTAATSNLSSAGAQDAFLAQYFWPDNIPPTGTITGSNTCTGDPATLTFTASAGVGPFTVTYNNGVSNITQQNAQSGVPFAVTPVPGVTTQYTLIGVRDAQRCSETNFIGGTATIIVGGGTDFDFNFDVDVCNPYSVQFTGVGTVVSNAYWSFGDNTTATATLAPAHTYATAGTYLVKYSVGNAPCADTVRKNITIGIIPDDIILTPDTTICYNTTKQLRTAPSLEFCWSPVTYLSDPNSPNPVTSTPSTIKYYFTAKTTSGNLIVNGDFSQGNTGFTSAYNFATTNTTEGQYNVGSNPQAWNAGMNACSGHNGPGNMLLVNGSPVVDQFIWKQTINVTPNTNYAFSTWIQSVSTANPAQLQFSVNNRNMGSLITATLPPCNWQQFYTTWNSGTATTATISIVNKNTIVAGNDFALDDISFAPVLIKRDSVTITVDTPRVTTINDIAICKGTAVQLNTTGAQSYSWSPATGLSSPSVASPVATPQVNTQYIVIGTTAAGCEAKDTVNVSFLPVPVIVVSNDTIICVNTPLQLFASGGVSYLWSPAATLDNAAIFNPVATPQGSTKYYVDVTDGNSCHYLDSVQVDVKQHPQFTVNGPGKVCYEDTILLVADGGDQYQWQPAASVSNPLIANPLVYPLATTTYMVTITELICNESVTLSKEVVVLPLPSINATKSADLDCSNDRSQLAATGGVQYAWSPAGSLDRPLISNPVARPAITTQYTVKGIDAEGCINYDTVTVNVGTGGLGLYLMPSGFTPNNDGLNDCYGVKYWGVIEKIKFSIYNRWGERVFYADVPGRCWDGVYKGVPQDSGVFVYMIEASTICEKSVFRKGTFTLIR